MSSLLRIPLEIKHEIFRWVICSPAEPPASPALEQEHRNALPYGAFLSRGIWNDGDYLSRGVWYRPTANPALSLLQVSKQINAEVTSFLQCLPANYNVDVMYVKESGVWPTWTIPALPRTPYIDSVHATVRIFDPPETLEDYFRYRLATCGGSGDSYSFYTCFYGLLAAVFNRGPGLMDRSHPEDDDSVAPRYVVKNILIDIVTPADGTGLKSILVDDKRYEAKRRLISHFKGHNDTSLALEERLARHLIGWLEMTLDFRAFMQNIAMKVYEQMSGSFVFMVNGKEFKTIEVEECLQKWVAIVWDGTEIQDPGEKGDIFCEWKDWVNDRRRKMKKGLELDNVRPVPKLWQR